MLLCYGDHHDKAYAWAERRKLETHPMTGAAQFVPKSGRFAVKVINHLGDEVMKVFKV